MADVRWGVLVPTFDPFATGQPPVLQAARRAEELGFDAIWVGDHLLCPAPVLDSLCALSAASAVTSRVDLGVSVLQLGLRHLVWTAKQLVTIDALAPGRLRLGVGVGGEFPDELTAAGVEHKTRGRRLDEMLEVLGPLLRGEPVDHEGAHLSVRLSGLRPAIGAVPPLVVGGRSEQALVRAARYGDQWLGMWHDPATVKDSVRRLGELAAKEGRATPTVAMLVIVNVNAGIDAARQEVTEGLYGQYRLPLRVVERWTAYGPPARVARMLVEYIEVGVSELVLLPAARDVLAQYEQLATVRELVRAS